MIGAKRTNRFKKQPKELIETMSKVINLDKQRTKSLLGTVEEMRSQLEPCEFFTRMAPVTLGVLQSIDPKEGFAEDHKRYIEALQKEIANPLVDKLKRYLDELEKICHETPNLFSKASFFVMPKIYEGFQYYNELIRDRIRILKRAETEGTRKPPPDLDLGSLPPRNQPKPTGKTNVKRLDAVKIRADIETLKKATNGFAYTMKELESSFGIVSRNHELDSIPEVSFITQDLIDGSDSIVAGMRQYCDLVERAVQEMESEES
jgi:hypothetical protein